MTPAAAVARIRDAIFTLVAGVAGLPDALSTWAEAASSTDFIIESARRDALDVLLDRRFFSLDDAQYKEFAKALDNPPPPNEKLKRLMASKAPWEK